MLAIQADNNTGGFADTRFMGSKPPEMLSAFFFLRGIACHCFA